MVDVSVVTPGHKQTLLFVVGEAYGARGLEFCETVGGDAMSSLSRR